MSHILTQEEVDALLRGISGGEIETEVEQDFDPSEIVSYDLTSQDRIIRGRMPTLEMTNEKFARMLRTTLSSLLRKMVSVSALSVDMIKFGEFLKTLPVPTSLHLFRMDPMRGSALIVLEPRLIFTLIDILFGGLGKDNYKIEGREFTAIENSVIKKIVLSALVDLEKAWKSLINLTVSYQRSEVNPQFVQIVPPTDVVVLINFEIEIEYTTGILALCLPYSTLEPIREKLAAGFQSEQLEVDRAWMDRFKKSLVQSRVEVVVELGRAQIATTDVLQLRKGDVILLDQYATDPLNVFVEGNSKFLAFPGLYKGSQAVKIADILRDKEVFADGTE